VVFGLLALWVGVTAPLPGWLWWLMPLVALLLAWTIVNRIRGGLRSVEAV
jgi:CDP-diacylglycerol--glycerol-3-phosphate 3-phosphatidyltransferase